MQVIHDGRSSTPPRLSVSSCRRRPQPRRLCSHARERRRCQGGRGHRGHDLEWLRSQLRLPLPAPRLLQERTRHPHRDGRLGRRLREHHRRRLHADPRLSARPIHAPAHLCARAPQVPDEARRPPRRGPLRTHLLGAGPRRNRRPPQGHHRPSHQRVRHDHARLGQSGACQLERGHLPLLQHDRRLACLVLRLLHSLHPERLAVPLRPLRLRRRAQQGRRPGLLLLAGEEREALRHVRQQSRRHARLGRRTVSPTSAIRSRSTSWPTPMPWATRTT